MITTLQMVKNLKGFLIFKVHFPKWGIYLL